jgi:hypothetical protein
MPLLENKNIPNQHNEIKFSKNEQNFQEIIVSKKEFKKPKKLIDSYPTLDPLDKDQLLPDESFD